MLPRFNLSRAKPDRLPAKFKRVTFKMENFVLIGVFVMLGMLLRRIEAFPRDTPQVLNMFALYVSLPALILLKAPQIAFSRDDLVVALVPWGMLLFSAALVLRGDVSGAGRAPPSGCCCLSSPWGTPRSWVSR